MSRIAACFTELKHRQAKALVTFITAGDPDLATTADLICLLEEAGADIIELGVPFSDPMADGPTIQLASERALRAGTTLPGILETVRQTRLRTQIPILLMGYCNPLHAYGYERFFQDAAQSGVDGVLIVDLPPEESAELLSFARLHGVDVIFLLTPTSDRQRIETVNRLGRGFIYYVTVTGVTGARQQVSGTLSLELSTVMQQVQQPVVAGFGISTPAQAADVAKCADGVVVGSALVKLFETFSGPQLEQELRRFVSSLKQALSS